MSDLSPTELMEAVLLCFMTPMDGNPTDSKCLWGLVPNIIGDPGVAKTACVKQLCREIGADAVILKAGTHAPEDFSSALIPDGKGGATNICAIPQVRKMIQYGIGVIFLDEANQAPPAVQAALQGFIHERQVGDQELPGRIRLIAAINPESIATAGHRLSPALANRYVHLDYSGGTAEDWRNWNMTGGTPKVRSSIHDLEGLVQHEWENKFPSAQGLFNGFVSRHPTRLHELPARNSKQSGLAWPSRRTMDFAQRAWATAAILKTPEEVRDIVIEGCLGEGAMKDFTAYHTTTKLPEPQEVLDGTWTIDMTRLDIVIGAYTAMINYVVGKTAGRTASAQPGDAIDQFATKSWGAVGRLLKTDPPLTDLMVPAIKALGRGGLGRDSGRQSIKDASAPILLTLDRMGITNI
jgi:hypothetical protein